MVFLVEKGVNDGFKNFPDALWWGVVSNLDIYSFFYSLQKSSQPICCSFVVDKKVMRDYEQFFDTL